jgi:histidinol-phosphate aminotransferase
LWNIIRPPFNVTRISEYAAIAALEDQAYLKDVTAKNAKERETSYNSCAFSVTTNTKFV